LLAKALASLDRLLVSRGLQFHPPTLLPSDVTGVNVFNQRTKRVPSSVPGRCSPNLLLVDEINPRLAEDPRPALLESMQENQVTVDGVSYELAARFMVVATPEPDRVRGPPTRCPRPSSTASRLRIEIGYPAAAGGGLGC